VEESIAYARQRGQDKLQLINSLRANKAGESGCRRRVHFMEGKGQLEVSE
jgi:hypothetical protein